MNCEKECYWNFDNICVHEDEEKYDQGNPTDCEKCPNWLRKDFDKHFFKTLGNIAELLKNRNCAELEEIEQFILNQRNEDQNAKL